MPDDLAIRPMTRHDVTAVTQVDQKCFPLPWSANAFLAEIGNLSACYLVAHVDTTLAGYIGAWIVMDEVHITTLGVEPAWRRQGVADRLLAALLAEAVRRGARRASLEVRVSNLQARRLYEKYGFRAVGRRNRYYTDNGEDAVVMWIEDMTERSARAQLEACWRALETAGAGPRDRDVV